ncbi:hypothetical protein [Aeromicrobium sp. UC242_57]
MSTSQRPEPSEISCAVMLTHEHPKIGDPCAVLDVEGQRAGPRARGRC